MQQRIEAFPMHYPWIPPEALDYFKSRLVQAPRDSEHGLRHRPAALHHESRRQRQAFEALAFKLEMLWAMIDTIHHAYREDVSVASSRSTSPCRSSGVWPAWTTTPSASGPCCSIPRAPCC